MQQNPITRITIYSTIMCFLNYGELFSYATNFEHYLYRVSNGKV